MLIAGVICVTMAGAYGWWALWRAFRDDEGD
jgi:hypothetical protein